MPSQQSGETVSIPDETLVRQARRGSQDAFAALVARHQRYVYNLAYRLLRDTREAEDLTQEAFLSAWRGLHGFRGEAKFTTWLYRIVTNLCYDRIKTNKRRSRLMQREIDPESVAGSCDLEKEMDNTELAEIILYLSEALSPKQHTVFVLRDLHGLNINEVIKITGLSKAAVKSNLFHARACIRNKFEQLHSIHGDYDEM